MEMILTEHVNHVQITVLLAQDQIPMNVTLVRLDGSYITTNVLFHAQINTLDILTELVTHVTQLVHLALELSMENVILVKMAGSLMSMELLVLKSAQKITSVELMITHVKFVTQLVKHVPDHLLLNV
jgi:hypothetical protein